jgi:hypothetical protein
MINRSSPFRRIAERRRWAGLGFHRAAASPGAGNFSTENRVGPAGRDGVIPVEPGLRAEV